MTGDYRNQYSPSFVIPICVRVTLVILNAICDFNLFRVSGKSIKLFPLIFISCLQECFMIDESESCLSDAVLGNYTPA